MRFSAALSLFSDLVFFERPFAEPCEGEGDATPQDVIALVEEVRRRVRAARGIELQTELRLIA